MTGQAAPASAGAVRSAAAWREIALSQAEEIARQDECIRELIRDGDALRDAREAALVLAGEYARKAGIDLDRDEAARWAAQWWEQIARLDRDRHELEARRWSTLNLAMQLDDLAVGKRTTDLDVPGLAKVLAEELRAVNTAQKPRGPQEMFKAPPLPGTVA